jgi:hypothetical protein
VIHWLAFIGGIRTPGLGVRDMPRPGVKVEWNADKSGSIVTCTHPNCDKWPNGRQEFRGPKEVGAEQARWHRGDHARRR